ncbi:NAD-dependent epimerase/dehydratase family protein [Streptomyces sp. NPDC096153]|uniref:NAD-dependent epimerase/dehydratase family protein n=1 Tax=Streptomyces sp. NPDC096153 TaxID=3155548 RepID=UPI003330A3D1
MTKHVLLTGAAGFVGSHVLRRVLETTEWTVSCPISLRHHGNSDRITPLLERPDWAARLDVFLCDLACGIPDTQIDRIGRVDYILNIASNSGVEESIADPTGFVRNNVELMGNVLEFARLAQPDLMLHMGTDEEYGPAPDGYAHREWDTILPSNPYAASKAAQSAMATAAWRTYGLPIVLTRTMNLIGPGQSGEKLVPTVIRKVLDGDTVPIYASTDGVPGARHWIDAREFGDAWLHLIRSTTPQKYPADDRPSLWHIVGVERSNLELAQAIADHIGRPLKYELVSFHASRPGHDLRYALDGTKLAEAGWSPTRSLEETIADCVEWYLANPAWLRTGVAA